MKRYNTLMKKSLIFLGAMLAVGAALYHSRDKFTAELFEPTESTVEGGNVDSRVRGPEIVATELDIPWELVFLPDGDLLVTERPGRLLRIDEYKNTIPISGVAHRGEGGLLGLALHPNFAENQLIYLYLTTASGSGLTNRVERYRLDETALSARKVIIEGIPGAANHDGGRIAFGPDGMLYIATGDAGKETSAQDTASLAGKILRLNDDGSIPSDNPFGNAVYSYGHRNVQGLAWDDSGRLWATEHGRSGFQSGYDEVNLIEKGKNYGWPTIEGGATRAGMVAPALHSGAEDTWAPSGMAQLHGYLYFAGLRGESLYVVDISSGEAKDLKSYLRGTYGRLRSVTAGPDGMLYVLTNNRDGRGSPKEKDDKIIRIDPRSFSTRI